MMTDPIPDPDLQRIIEDLAPEDRALTIPDPSPALRELVEITGQFSDADVERVLNLARHIADQHSRSM